MIEPTNPSEFFTAVKAAIDAGHFPENLDKNLMQEALAEIVGAMVGNFMSDKEPSACEKIVGQIFIAAVQGQISA